MQFLSRDTKTISYIIYKPTFQLGKFDMKMFHTQHHTDKSTKYLSTSIEDRIIIG